jgi:hypothetical protein
MANSYPSSTSSPSMPSSTSYAGTAPTDNYTPTEWTQQNMVGDLMQQKGLFIGLGMVLVAFLYLRSRSRPEEQAARRLVRDWRHVDGPDDARGLLGENLPTILRPALLAGLEEIEHQVERGFLRLEREIERL